MSDSLPDEFPGVMVYRLNQVARDVASMLEATNTTLVLAESCTSGLAAAAMASVSGISRRFCGSAVVYQEATKTAWIDVSRETLDRVGAVAREVAAEMAEGVLRKTPHAIFSASITGHLGPNATPPELDGVVWMGFAARREDLTVSNITEEKVQLGQPTVLEMPVRLWRQYAAAVRLLIFVRLHIEAACRKPHPQD